MKALDVLIPAPFLDESKLVAGFTHRNAHIKTSSQIQGLHFNGALEEEKQHVHHHYRLVAAEAGFEAENVTWLTQIHGDVIQYADRAGFLGEGDSLVTDKQGLVITVRVADCAAVLMADLQAGVVAATHAGWKGARLNIVSKTIEKMKVLGANPSRLKVYVSPCISTAHFEVGEEVAAEFPEKYVKREGFAKPHVDLKQFLRDELLASGVPESHVQLDGRCTVEDSESLYSYRREGKISGRMIGFIGMRKA